MSRICAIVLATALFGSCTASSKMSSTQNSLDHYQFSQLDSLIKREPRPVAVFLHAPWCQYCRNMEHTTFKNPRIVNILNTQFYFVSFDGEQREAVIFKQKSFRFRPIGRDSGTHELATALGTIEGNFGFPTLTILNPSFDIVFQNNSFLSAKSLVAVLEASVTSVR